MKAILYCYFSLIAIAVNLLFQCLVFTFSEKWWTLYLALMLGNLAGLASKYLLDKNWIFNYQANSKADDLHKFGLYSLMGVFTTIIFLGSEMMFFHSFTFNGSQYVGGALGLSIGYVVKYYLDKRFVFK